MSVSNNPARYPKPIECGGWGNCGLYSLLNQVGQYQENQWSKCDKENMLALRHHVSIYAQNKIEELTNSPEFCLDFFDDLKTIKAESLDPFLKNIQLISQIDFLTEIEQKEAIFNEYYLQKDSSNLCEAQIAKEALLKCYASYIQKGGVQVDKLFWNLYTRLADDEDFITNTLGASESEFPFKQVLLTMKISGSYKFIGLWPKQDHEEINLSACAFIYYDGKGHYQSFNRNQIADYLTREDNFLDPGFNPQNCTLF